MARLVILLVALACGSLAAWLSVGGNTELATRAEASHSQVMTMPQVLVAATNIKPGTALSDTDFSWMPWPRAAVSEELTLYEDNPDAPSALAGRVARNGFIKGEPIHNDKIAGPGSNLLSLALPSGMRAVAVKISAERTAGGFIMPHDRVDVIHTAMRHQAGNEGSRSHSTTILRNIRVLAVDQMSGQMNVMPDGAGKTATVEVSPYQAEILATAENSGTISLALRSTLDTADTHVETTVPNPSISSIRVVSRGKAEVIEVKRSSR